MQKEVQEYVKKCNQYQRFAPNIHQPGCVLNPLSSPCPFIQWGLDIVGPFLRAVGNRKWLLVGTDYFMKWVEESLSNIRDIDAKKFVWKSIVTQVGIPYTLISNNGLLFDSKPSGDIAVNWALGMGIQLQPIRKEMGKLKQSTKS